MHVYYNSQMQLLVDTGSSNLAVACEPDSAVDHYFHRDKYGNLTSQFFKT